MGASFVLGAIVLTFVFAESWPAAGLCWLGSVVAALLPVIIRNYLTREENKKMRSVREIQEDMECVLFCIVFQGPEDPEGEESWEEMREDLANTYRNLSEELFASSPCWSERQYPSHPDKVWRGIATSINPVD